MICNVYKTPKKEGLYLYVDKAKALNALPETLQSLFGSGQLVMTLLLTADKKLGNANSQDVINAIRDQGFYLQMPVLENEAFYGVVSGNS